MEIRSVYFENCFPVRTNLKGVYSREPGHRGINKKMAPEVTDKFILYPRSRDDIS